MRDINLTLPPASPDTAPRLSAAFDRLTHHQVMTALVMIDHHGGDWLQHRTGLSGAGRILRVQGRQYPLKATGYLAAQLAAGLDRVEGSPVTLDRVVRALCRCGFDVT